MSNSNDELRALVNKKKSLLRADSTPQEEDGVPVYAQPPFWARAKG